MQPTLVAAHALASLAAGALYLVVGSLVSHRAVAQPARLAARSFSMWWRLLGAVSILGVALDLVTLTHGWSTGLALAWWQTVIVVLLLAVLAALTCLVYFLLYVYTGRAGLWLPVAAFYGVIFVAYLLYIFWADPIAIDDSGAFVQPLFRHDVHAPPLAAIAVTLGAVLTLPILGAAVAYFSLLFRTSEPTPRYRISLTATALVLWFSFSLGGTLLGRTGQVGYVFASQAVSVLAALMVYAAYRPPAWVQRRWRVAAL